MAPGLGVTAVNWNGTDPLARYRAVGIELVENRKKAGAATRFDANGGGAIEFDSENP